MNEIMYAVCVKPNARKKICLPGQIWVKNKTHEYYVSKKERGIWPTKLEAKKHITEPYEIVVEAV